MQRRHITYALALAVAIALVSALVSVLGSGGGGDAAPAGASAGSYRAHVERVVDGDTLIVRSASGDRLRVRVIGIDTPEDVKPDTPVECWSRQAAAFTHEQLDGRDVVLTPGRERFDKYGRTLAYVERDDGVELETALLRGGYARTLAIAPNIDRAARYASLEDAARRAGRGLWGACPNAAAWAAGE
jgi:micrococcal nuclease